MACCRPGIGILSAMRILITELSAQLWIVAQRVSAYAVVHLLDDPALLAMAFC